MIIISIIIERHAQPNEHSTTDVENYCYVFYHYCCMVCVFFLSLSFSSAFSVE